VTMFATRLLNGEDIPAKPDLATHSLIHFLDRFVYRNPTAPRTNLRGTSIMQPLAGGERHDVVVSNSAVQRKVEPVNSESFWRKKAEDVAVDEAFFHIYFNQVAKGKQSGKKEKPAKHAEEDGEENGDDDEDEVWQALVESRPEIEGGSEGDSDLDLGLDDLESDYSDDDDDDMDVDVEDDDVSAIVESDGAPELGDDDDQSDMDALFEKEAASNSKPEAVEEDNKSRRAQRKRLKNLPVFASVDDYAQMIEDNEGED
jgi:ribosome biogenesis protein MAK21